MYIEYTEAILFKGKKPTEECIEEYIWHREEICVHIYIYIIEEVYLLWNFYNDCKLDAL